MSEPRRSRPPVIADVARHAGVSVPTVSRVLSGTVRVSQERRDRVMKAIDELGFRPNGAARALARGDHSMIAVFTGNTTRYGYAATIQGIEEAAREADHIITIAVVEHTSEASVSAEVNLVLSQPLAGAIVLEYDPPGVAAVSAMPPWLPVVAVGSGEPSDASRPHAYIDDRHAATHATRHLLDLGHRTVHHIATPRAGQANPRTQGWLDALKAAGAPIPEATLSDWEPLAGYNVARHVLSNPDVTAILCGNDDMAVGAAKAAKDAGLRVPEDLSLIGFDDQPLSMLWDPPLTTVRQDFVALGREAYRLLFAHQSQHDAPARTRFVPDLIVRGSTARPRSF